MAFCIFKEVFSFEYTAHWLKSGFTQILDPDLQLYSGAYYPRDEKVNFGVFSNFERHLAVKATLLDCKTVYFLVCPECASVFTVEEARGKAFQKGEKLSIGNFDLKPLKEFKSEV